MNTKSIYTVGKCLLLLLLIFTGYACEDNDEGKENTSAPVLIHAISMVRRLILLILIRKRRTI